LPICSSDSLAGEEDVFSSEVESLKLNFKKLKIAFPDRNNYKFLFFVVLSYNIYVDI